LNDRLTPDPLQIVKFDAKQGFYCLMILVTIGDKASKACISNVTAKLKLDRLEDPTAGKTDQGTKTWRQ
jgi:hypothetical protein